jgi:hypothetical protein
MMLCDSLSRMGLNDLCSIVEADVDSIREYTDDPRTEGFSQIADSELAARMETLLEREVCVNTRSDPLEEEEAGFFIAWKDAEKKEVAVFEIWRKDRS